MWPHPRRYRRRQFIQGSLALASLSLLSGCRMTGPGSAPSRIPQVGYLSVGPDGSSPAVDAFRQGLRELGYVEGQSIGVVYRYAGERTDRLADFAAEFVRAPVDVIVARGAPAIQAAKDATRTIPIVFPVSGNPIELGFVESLARPAGNLTGLTNLSQHLSSKRLELLKETIQLNDRVAVLWHRDDGGVELSTDELPAAARKLQVELLSVELGTPVDLGRAFDAAAAGHADAALTLGGPRLVALQGRIAELAAERHLPIMYHNREAVEAGGLLAYGANLPDLFRRTATYVHKILGGARPADLPVEGPTTFDFSVNLKAAQALGLAIPESVMKQATEVIQ